MVQRPAIRRYPPKHALETDLKTLADAANEAAKREAAQWFYFVTIMITLAAVIGSTTHRVLFLEDPVKVPILSVELPLRGFYVVAPAIFLVLHFYLLAQVRLMAGKVGPFLNAVERAAGADLVARDRALKRLDSFSVAQLLAADRFGQTALALRLMVSVTLVIAPVLMMLFFQLRFLPFHDAAITWWHRAMVLTDLALLWWLWPFVLPDRARCRPRRDIATGLVGSAAVGTFVLAVAVFPTGREPDGAVEHAAAWLFDGGIGIDQRPISLFSRRLVLPDQDFVPEDDKAREGMLRTRVLRGRNLEFAVLDRADLRKADLTGAKMRRATLNHAQLQGASLDGAQMQGASLDGVQMRGGSLNRAQMQGVSLNGAQMQGASLEEAQMQGVSLNLAQMQGASLDGAQMQGVSLNLAQMQGASLYGAQMQGSWLFGAEMQGVMLTKAQMQGALLDFARLQGAWLSAAQLQGASLLHLAVWKTSVPDERIEDAHVSADRNLNVDKPPCVAPGPFCQRSASWRTWIDEVLESIPAHRRGAASERFLALLQEEMPTPAEAQRFWDRHPTPDPERVTFRLGSLACYAEAAPHVARGLLRQIKELPPFGRTLGNHRAALAERLAGANCPGAHGLTEAERARLIAIAAGRD